MKSRAVYSILVTCCLTYFFAKNQAASFPSKENPRIVENVNEFTKRDQSFYAGDETKSDRLWKSKDQLEVIPGMIFQGEKTVDQKELKWRNESASFEDKKCSRYCIRKIKDEEYETRRRVNLFLSFTNDFIAAENYTMDKKSKFEIIENDLLSDQNCEICLEIDCQLSDAQKNFHLLENTTISKDNDNNDVLDSMITLVEGTETKGQTEVSFHIDDWMSIMNAYVRGNLSGIVFGIPGKDETMMGMDFKISLARLEGSQWMVIEARNPPPGRWSLKFAGDEDLTYDLTIIGGVVDGEEMEEENGVSSDDFIDAESTISETAARERRQFDEDEKLAGKLAALDDVEIVDLDVHQIPRKWHGNEDKGFEEWKNPEKQTTDSNSNTIQNFANAKFSRDREDNSISTSEKYNVDFFPNSMNFSNDGNVSLKMIELVNDSELAELEDFRFPDADNAIRRKAIRIDVNPNSKLIVPIDETTNRNVHRIFFDLKNNQAATARFEIRASSSPLRIFNVAPPELWLAPGEIKGVIVDILLPRGIVQENINIVTLFVTHKETIEKKAYMYIQTPNSKTITDSTKPTIDYTFVGNCNGKLHRDHCSKYFWGADIKITDSESGLKYVSASPNDLYEQTDFVTGTKNPVMFYYSANCCSTTIKVTAIDLLNNENTHTIDVTVWDNLSEAEIAVIVVGVFLVILLIILIVILIIYCIRRRKSHDLPYSQRYGSRPPARTEGTSF